MGSKCQWVLMFVSFAWCLSQACLDEERVALLQLKPLFNGNSYRNLLDWVDGEMKSDCCQWGSVKCSNTTGRVIVLNLSGTRNWNLGEWYLNVSLFSVFEELEGLDLSENYITGFVENEDLHKLSRLSNLESLDLKYNMFSNDILSSLPALSSLKKLYLSYNELEGTIDLQSLDSHNKLRSLYLDNNEIVEVIFPQDLNKSRLSNLEDLELQGNKLNNDILSSLDALPSLRQLILSNINLKGTIDLQGLDSHNKLQDLVLDSNEIEEVIFPQDLNKSRLSNLEYLDLQRNKLNNDILSSLDALPSLRRLFLNNNNLKGAIDLQGLEKLSKLSNLEYLYIGSNKLSNDILSSLDALPSLKMLDISNNSLKGVIDLQGLDSHNKLQYLYLEDNEIEELIFPQGLDKLSRLSNLEYLGLGSNKLSNEIVSSLDALPSLRELNINNNSLKGAIDLQGLDSHNKLQYLYLEDNEIEELIFPQDLNKSRLSNLEWLDLESNKLNNDILSSLDALPSLRQLFLNNNNLKGAIDLQGLYSLNSLESLDMSSNKIDKFIFSEDNKKLRNLSNLYLSNISIQDGNNLLQLLASFPSLETLDLSYNNFSQMTTEDSPHLKNIKNLKELIMVYTNVNITFLQIIGHYISSLESLYLSNGGLQGTISHQDLPHLKNTMNLKRLYMDNTNLNITFLQVIWLLTSSSLETLYLSNCGLQGTISLQDGGTLAQLLYHQHNLQVIDLSSNNLTGEFPNWLLENNSGLDYLNLANNSLGRHFQLPIHSHMRYLDISKNLFYGHIPKEIGGYLPSLVLLNFSHNHFAGSIPSSIGDMNSLETLDLSHNQLSGKIPEHLVEGCTSLRMLLLSNNSFEGQLFSSNFNLTILERLQLDGNHFIGKIPDSLSNASHLEGLYLSDNSLSGTLPSWLGNMSSLEDIIMPNNHLEGPIPSEFCQLEYLTILNLADNNLSGTLPHCFSSPYIEQIHLSKNRFQGQLNDFFVNSSFLVTLDLSYNQLHGSIPTWISLNLNLKHLMLRNNILSGELPIQLCQLNQLRLVDLSHNNLYGHIPPCLELTALHDNHNIDVDVDSTYISNGNAYRFGIIQIRNEELVEFTTKTLSYFYEGKVLIYMSGIDLSCNKLTGLIPQQVGNLTRIHTLNLSHNNLTGPIPLTFSKLKQIESLDLSYNNLNGKIPSQLVELNFLNSFSVAHNNLSGRTPKRIAQFATFEEKCYIGNPLLCGLPLNKSCDITGSPPPMPGALIDNEKDSDFIDIETFYMSFMGSYIIILIGIGAVLYINPYWRQIWFYVLEMWMISFYYFVVDNLPW